MAYPDRIAPRLHPVILEDSRCHDANVGHHIESGYQWRFTGDLKEMYKGSGEPLLLSRVLFNASLRTNYCQLGTVLQLSHPHPLPSPYIPVYATRCARRHLLAGPVCHLTFLIILHAHRERSNPIPIMPMLKTKRK